jgi:hypothetical protein
MYALGLCLVTSALSLADPLFQATVELPAAQALGITRHRCLLKAQIDTYVRLARRRTVIRHCHGQTQVPVVHRILGEGPASPFGETGQAFGLKDADGFTAKAQVLASSPQARSFKGHPTQGAARTGAHSPAKLGFFELRTAVCKFDAHPLNRVGTDLFETFRGASRQLAQVRSTQELTLPGEGSSGFDARGV